MGQITDKTVKDHFKFNTIYLGLLPTRVHEILQARCKTETFYSRFSEIESAIATKTYNSFILLESQLFSKYLIISALNYVFNE